MANFKELQREFNNLSILAGNNDCDAIYQLGMYYLALGEKKNAFEQFKRAYEINPKHIKSAHEYVYCLEFGRGVINDHDRAFSVCEKLVEDHPNDGRSVAMLSNMYRTGNGCTADLKRAFELRERAAMLGNTYAMLRLYDMYRDGTGCTKDTTKAIQWLTMAANLGDIDSQVKLGHHFKDTKPLVALRYYTMVSENARMMDGTDLTANIVYVMKKPEVMRAIATMMPSEVSVDIKDLIVTQTIKVDKDNNAKCKRQRKGIGTNHANAHCTSAKQR
jgi:TPR repeat protein